MASLDGAAALKNLREQGVGGVEQRRPRPSRYTQSFLIGAGGQKLLAQPLVGGHIGAAKTVDRLFAISDQIKAPWLRRLGISDEQPQKLGLQCVSVLKFVDEQRRKALLLAGTHRGNVAQKVPRPSQKVGEIKRRRPPLMCSIHIDQDGQQP